MTLFASVLCPASKQQSPANSLRKQIPTAFRRIVMYLESTEDASRIDLKVSSADERLRITETKIIIPPIIATATAISAL